MGLAVPSAMPLGDLEGPLEMAEQGEPALLYHSKGVSLKTPSPQHPIILIPWLVQPRVS